MYRFLINSTYQDSRITANKSHANKISFALSYDCIWAGQLDTSQLQCRNQSLIFQKASSITECSR